MDENWEIIMNEKQIQSAQENMLEWLTDPHELGKMPYKIELSGEFDLHGLHYYAFDSNLVYSPNGLLE